MRGELATDLVAFVEGWELFRLSALSGALAGGLLGMLGVYVVLRRLVFLTAAVSQAAGLGVALAFFAQLHWGISAALASPTVGATLLTTLAVLLVFIDRGNTLGARRDSWLGLAYLVGAAGSLAVATRIAQEMHDVQSILFGSAVAVLPEQFETIAVTTLLIGALHVWWARGFCTAAFDPYGARVRGLPVNLIEMVFFASLAIALSVFTRVLGALPTFAFSVLPAMAAVRLTPNVRSALWLAAALGAVSGFAGYVWAFLHELPVGAAQSLMGVLFVAVAECIARLRRWALRLDRRAESPA